jgi:DNA-binding GntR family transcriptional regulator
MVGMNSMPVSRKPAARKPRTTIATAASKAPRNLAMVDAGATSPPADEASLVSQAYTRIEEQIARLQLAPGQVVSENMLSAMLNLGRTPVREALQQLAREGLVVILPKRGIVISQIDVRKQLRLLELRRHVERCVVSLAARRADAAQRARFEALAREMDAVVASNDGNAFLVLDGEFNQLLLASARNEYATSTMKLLQGLSRRFWFANWRTSADLPETVRLHADIARAVARGAEADAEAALDRLLDNVEAFTRATLDADPVY